MTQNLNLKKGLKKGQTRHSPYYTYTIARERRLISGCPLRLGRERRDIRKYVTILSPPHQRAFAPIGLTGWFVYPFIENLPSLPGKIQLERGNSSLCLNCIYIECRAREA